MATLPDQPLHQRPTQVGGLVVASGRGKELLRRATAPVVCPKAKLDHKATSGYVNALLPQYCYIIIGVCTTESHVSAAKASSLWSREPSDDLVDPKGRRITHREFYRGI